jgi:hypothetical protein
MDWIRTRGGEFSFSPKAGVAKGARAREDIQISYRWLANSRHIEFHGYGSGLSGMVAGVDLAGGWNGCGGTDGSSASSVVDVAMAARPDYGPLVAGAG